MISNNIKGEDMRNVFDIRLEAISEHNRANHNLTRYKAELQDLAKDIGRHSSESDKDLLYLYRMVKRELSFIMGSHTVVGSV